MTRHLLIFPQLTLFLTAFLLLPASTAIAQPPDTLWTHDYGAESAERVECIRAVPGGGYVITGDTRVGPGMYGVRTIRTDEDGNEIWALVENGGETDGVSYIEPTTDGGFIQGGSTLSYSPNFTWEGYVRKLNENGEQQWARLIGTDNIDDWVACVREVPVGGYVAVGMNNAQPFLWRLGPQGQQIWVRHWPSEFDNRPNFVEPTTDGGFLIGGQYPDWFSMAKTDSHGNIIWSQQYWDDGWIYCVREFSNGNIVASGRRFYNLLSSAWVVIMTDPSGDIIWQHEFDENNFTAQQASECWITADGNIVVCGVDQDEDYSINRWIVKYDTLGNVLWHSIIPGGELISICQGRNGSVLVGGTVQDDWTLPSNYFRVIKFDPEVEIDLQAWTPVIPSSGGWLRYGAQVTNILIDPTPLDAWIVVTGPNGERVPLNSFPVTLQPGATFTRPQINIWIPAIAPNGEYTLEAHLGVAPPEIPPGGPTGSRNMGLGSFTFTKVQP